MCKFISNISIDAGAEPSREKHDAPTQPRVTFRFIGRRKLNPIRNLDHCQVSTTTRMNACVHTVLRGAETISTIDTSIISPTPIWLAMASKYPLAITVVELSGVRYDQRLLFPPLPS